MFIQKSHACYCYCFVQSMHLNISWLRRSNLGSFMHTIDHVHAEPKPESMQSKHKPKQLTSSSLKVSPGASHQYSLTFFV
jgi:hypothetical protein